MRIISGKYKRRRFDVPRTFKARPTTDFAKENIFNVLCNNYIDFDEATTALDLFAGTGGISLELVSRGCGQVVCVEKERAHHAFIVKVLKELGTNQCKPLLGDAFKFLRNGRGESFDFIFADPPYSLTELDTIPDLVFGHNLLKPDGVFVFEHGKDHTFESHQYFVEKRVYGSVNFSIFQIKPIVEEPVGE